MDLEAALGQFNNLMKDEASAQKIKDIAEVLNKTVTANQSNAAPAEQNQANNVNLEDMISQLSSNTQLQQMISSIKDQVKPPMESNKAAPMPDSNKLLEALRPFLSDQKQGKVDEVKQLLKLVNVAKLLDIGGKNA